MSIMRLLRAVVIKPVENLELSDIWTYFMSLYQGSFQDNVKHLGRLNQDIVLDTNI